MSLNLDSYLNSADTETLQEALDFFEEANKALAEKQKEQPEIDWAILLKKDENDPEMLYWEIVPTYTILGTH